MLIQLSSLGVISIVGDNAEKFLQGQLTCDVRQVTEQLCCLGAHCDPKGRVQIFFYLLKQPEGYYLVLEKSLILHALTLLNKYAVFSKVRLMDVSDEWDSIGIVQTENPLNELSEYFSAIPEAINQVVTNSGMLLTKVTDAEYLLISPTNNNLFPRGLLREQGHEGLSNKLNFALQSDENKWWLANIKAGIPRITEENIGEFTPHDINLPLLNAVSFNKGCYTGQEIIARMHYLGKLKQKMVVIRFSCESSFQPKINDSLINAEAKQIGSLVTFAYDETNKHYFGLAVLQNNALDSSIFFTNSPHPVGVFL